MGERIVRLTILVLLGLLLFPAVCAAADESSYRLRVYYLEFPPYYYTNAEDEPDGFLLNRAKAIFEEADIEPVWEPMPAKRILQELHSSSPAASIGWFKTPNRETYARFSLPIYRNKPLEVLHLARNSGDFENKRSLGDVLRDRNLELGVLEGYSYGYFVDSCLLRDKPRVRYVVGEYAQLVGMLGLGRFDYILVSPEETQQLVAYTDMSTDEFCMKKMEDIPDGNLRFLMFSQGVPQEMLDKVNQAITDLDILY